MGRLRRKDSRSIKMSKDFSSTLQNLLQLIECKNNQKMVHLTHFKRIHTQIQKSKINSTDNLKNRLKQLKRQQREINYIDKDFELKSKSLITELIELKETNSKETKIVENMSQEIRSIEQRLQKRNKKKPGEVLRKNVYKEFSRRHLYKPKRQLALFAQPNFSRIIPKSCLNTTMSMKNLSLTDFRKSFNQLNRTNTNKYVAGSRNKLWNVIGNTYTDRKRTTGFFFLNIKKFNKNLEEIYILQGSIKKIVINFHLLLETILTYIVKFSLNMNRLFWILEKYSEFYKLKINFPQKIKENLFIFLRNLKDYRKLNFKHETKIHRTPKTDIGEESATIASLHESAFVSTKDSKEKRVKAYNSERKLEFSREKRLKVKNKVINYRKNKPDIRTAWKELSFRKKNPTEVNIELRKTKCQKKRRRDKSRDSVFARKNIFKDEVRSLSKKLRMLRTSKI